MVDEYLLKVCVVGSTDLQTKMLQMFTYGKLRKNKWSRVPGSEIDTKRIEVQNNQIKLIIVDTSNLPKKLRPGYYRGASAAVITFDKSDKDTFKVVKGWLKEFRKYIPDPNVPIGLAGIITKSEEVTTEEGKALADELGVDYYETTVSDKGSIEEIFRDLTKKALATKEL